MATPLVAVVGYRLPRGRVEGWSAGAYAVPDRYFTALWRAGASPAIIGAPDREEPAEILERFDGLMLLGGPDVDPGRYGEEPHPRTYGVDPDRDRVEIELVRAAAESRLPTLAICRGIQLANVAFGGTLLQHLPDLPDLDQHGTPLRQAGSHEVKIAEGSRLFSAAGEATLTCWSSHHQGLGRLGKGLAPVAWSGDGLVEAVEHEEGWFVAVQWHPEETAATDPRQQALFDAFAEEAAGRLR